MKKRKFLLLDDESDEEPIQVPVQQPVTTTDVLQIVPLNELKSCNITIQPLIRRIPKKPGVESKFTHNTQQSVSGPASSSTDNIPPKQEPGVQVKSERSILNASNALLSNYSKKVEEIDSLFIPQNTDRWMTRVTLPGIDNKVYGHVGTLFQTFSHRSECSSVGIHTPLQQAINGKNNIPAASVVASNKGGYHEEDYGDVMIYSGQGGGPDQDQLLTDYNLSLKCNHDRRIPVRLVRGNKLGTKYSPVQNYRYDGIYFVTGYWSERLCENGPMVFKFRMVRAPNQDPIPTRSVVSANRPSAEFLLIERANYNKATERRKSTLQKIKNETFNR
ncbi:hypothetical protein AKO1_001794 [Acrasis kona]|uniref:YDG domain-containing protein n=1 Tax=Acrasis kona TaxID=1008807 RepID=A0AAW2ZBL8_9EUKA